MKPQGEGILLSILSIKCVGTFVLDSSFDHHHVFLTAKILQVHFNIPSPFLIENDPESSEDLKISGCIIQDHTGTF